MTFRPCVIIPVYNHHQAISEIVERIKVFGLPCVLVDDGSERKTRDILQGLADEQAEVRVIRDNENRGKGAAVIQGLRMAYREHFTHALQIDADGQHTVEDIPNFINSAKNNPNCLITGIPIFDDTVPKGRLIGRYITNFWVWVETLSFQIEDAMCGFRVYPLNASIALINQVSMGNRMDFDIEILVRLYWRNVSIITIPTQVRYQQNGISHFKLFRDNMSISWLHTRLFLGMLQRIPSLLAKRVRKTSSESEHWSQSRERGSLLGMRILLFIYRILGRIVFKFMLYPVMGYFFLTGRSARNASLTFLQKVYQSDSESKFFSCKPAWKDSFKHFINFGDAIIDKFASWMGHIGHDQVNFPNRDEFMEYVRTKRGGFILVSHLGNIEVSRALADDIGDLRMNVLVHTKHAPKINKLLTLINPRVELEMIQVNSIGPELTIQLRDKIEQGQFVSMVADRTPVKTPHRVIHAEFLGSKAPFPVGPFLLAGLLDCPVFLMFCLKRQGRYTIYLERFSDSLASTRKDRQVELQKAVARYASRLEYYALREPLQWFNFFDFWHAA